MKEEARGATAAATGAQAATSAGAQADPGAAAATSAAAIAAAAEPAKAGEGAAKADSNRAGVAVGKQLDSAATAAATAAAGPPEVAAAPAPAPAGPPEAAPTAAAAAAPTEMVPTVTSPNVGEANFSVWMQAGKVKAGQQGVVEVVLVPKNGFHCNENYPYKIKMNDPPAGVSFPSPVVRKEGMSVSPARGVMRVPFIASSTGDAKIGGKFSFSVCSTNQCLMDARDVAITVKVE